MLKKLKVKNFKCFPEAEFSMAPLTVFCGANSAGKSTAIQCLLLLKQTHKANQFKARHINLTGELFSVGHVQDLMSQNIIGERIEIDIDGCNFISKKLIDINSENYTLPIENKISTAHALFTEPFHYLSAYRLAPQNSYDVNFEPDDIDFGIYGQYAISELQKHRLKPAINNKLAKLVVENNIRDEHAYYEHLNKKLNNFDALAENENTQDGVNYLTDAPETLDEIIEQYDKDAKDDETNKIKSLHTEKTKENREYSLEIALNEAMKKICKGFNININGYAELDKVANSFISSDTSYPVRPVNTGFGISNVLPIILAALCTPAGGLIIVENPEVHLHPAAQSDLAKFLGQASLCGVQVIIETHSDHIINGIRLFAKENKLENEHIIINSIRSVDGNRLITKIEVDENGSFTDIDEGFFDQAEKDLMRLF